MKLTINPKTPVKNEKTSIMIYLVGINTGIPTLGAKIKITITNNEKNFYYKANSGEKPGEYRSIIAFPSSGTWNIKIEIEHLNEFDTREYTIHVTESAPEHRSVMTDETRLFTHNTAATQPVPPLVLLGSVAFFILLLLGAVLIIKKTQGQSSP
jgi:hypothetical protein